MKEVRYFFTAVMFFTRIPCPSWVDHDAEYLNKSRKYFPLIGWIVGGGGALVYAICSWGLPPSLSILLSMAFTIWLTGAFHEDGFADVCDGFGGGWGKDHILTIMKDSRIGAYGLVGLVLLLAIKFFALYELALRDAFAVVPILIFGHTLSRFIASTFVHTHDYVQDTDQSKAKPIATSRLSIAEMIYSSLFVIILGILFYWNPLLLLAVVPAYLAKVYLGYYFKTHIGGYTGDCLGATQQLTEVVFYITVLFLWNEDTFWPLWQIFKAV
ncbi:MAG: adenosylcobinamide-GDP ribazoletransferase [Cyclobacteriaceae bacterium]|nr:adenosylcobinamide-GDP ribazoletransferase [Cyclobacteriaceae bacterium]MCH8516518.1 adenosylcobinamide-GDP ribazoletransferase [Cyclobacteriaceae bacterium]